MSHQNVELVRTFMAAANRRDFETMLRDYFKSLEGSFEDLALPVEDIIDAGDDQVLLLVRVCGRGKASGIAVEQRFGQVWTIVDGLVREVVSYPDPDDAFKAVGLPG